jgi:protease YdgD
MRPLALLVAGLVALSAHHGSAQERTTDLQKLEGANEALVWRAVGRLETGGSGFCTATLIAPDLVLTAAHCVYAPRDGTLMSPAVLSFRAGLLGEDVAAERRIAQVEAHPGFDPSKPLTAENIRHDVALLRLAEPIPTSLLDPFTVYGRPPGRGAVSVVSYGRGREDQPSRQKVCQMLEVRQGVIFMDCDVTFGSSGAPVFTHRNGRGQIVSVISGMGHVNGQRLTFGMELPARVAELRHQMRANRRGPIANARRVIVGRGNAPGGAKFIRPGGS